MNKKVIQNKKHYHVWDLPKNVFPRTKNNKSKLYARNLSRCFQSLIYTNKKVQESAQIASFHIKSISSSGGYNTSPKMVFPAIEDFVYEYENFCYRVYVLREQILRFINEILPVGYSEKQVKISHMVINPIVKNSKLLSEIEKFNNSKALGKIIKDRNVLTHQLYYKEIDHYLRPISFEPPKPEWIKRWPNEITGRAKMANSAMREITKINHEVAKKILEYKTQNKK